MKKFLPAVLSNVYGLALFAGFMSIVNFAYAESPLLEHAQEGPKAAVKDNLPTAINTFLNYFLGILGLIAVVMIVYAGILMVTAQGEEEQTTKGKKILIWAAIGLVLIMLSFAIVRFVVGAGDAGSGTVG